MSEAIVIGAGPAGSLSALLLARQKWRVAILEQHAFPRDKVCGECLSSRGIDVLRRIGLYDALQAECPVTLRLVNLHPSSGRSVCLRLPRPMMGVSRHLLDGFLLNHAVRAGAVVRHRIRCESIAATPWPEISVRDLATNQVHTLSAEHVIVADGKRALVGDPPPHTGDFGVKAHFRYVDGPRDAIEMFGCADCYGGVAAIEQNRWNVSFSVPAARLREVGNKLDQLLDQLLLENPKLRGRLGPARRCGPWLTSPVHRFGPGRMPGPNVICVGNGSAAMEPICGEGIGIALRSAESAAAALIASKAGAVRTPGQLRQYAREAVQVLRRNACRAAAVLASSPPAARLALTILESFALENSMLRLMGKN